MEALNHFHAAIAESRSCNPVDLLWLAGSLEGSAVAITQLLMMGNGISPSSIDAVLGKDLKALPPPASSYRNLDDPDDNADEDDDAAARETAEGKMLRLAHERAREALGIYKAYAKVAAVWAASVSISASVTAINILGAVATLGGSDGLSAAAAGTGVYSLSGLEAGCALRLAKMCHAFWFGLEKEIKVALLKTIHCFFERYI